MWWKSNYFNGSSFSDAPCFAFGGGHVAKAIVSIIEQLGWNYSIHDTRENIQMIQYSLRL